MRRALTFLNNLIGELKSSNSSLNKKAILNKYLNLNQDLFNRLMDYTYSYDKKYWLTSKNIIKTYDKKFDDVKHFTFTDQDNLFTVLDRIINREYTGHAALQYIIQLIKWLNNDEQRAALFCLIDKDLKANVNAALINEISPQSVKEFRVALAERYGEDAPAVHKINFQTQKWMISRKLDGVRTLAINNHDEIEFYSRTGSLFPTLKKMNDEVKAFLASAKKAYGEEYVLDGETCIIKDNKDDFNAIMKEITRKNHLVADPRYILFDLIKRSEFENTIGNEKFATRMQKLEHLITLHDFTYLKIVEHQNSITENDFIAWQQKQVEQGWEGLILRDENSVYNGKRSYDIQKVKNFVDREFRILRTEIGTKKMLNPTTGKMAETQCVSALVVQLDDQGNEVAVGSGLSDEQRVLWLAHPELVVNHIATIQYFEETIDSKTGKPSLRFPTLKVIYGENGRET